MAGNWRKAAKFVSTFALGATGGCAAVYINLQDRLIHPPSYPVGTTDRKVPGNYYTGYVNKPVVPWDYNWDQRHVDLPELESNKPDNPAADVNNNQPGLEQVNSNSQRRRPRATRHLLLIRHGQYNLKGETDQERVLTSLGIEQARLTGQRLAQLNLPLSYLVSSNMSRAQQTAGLVCESLPVNLTVLPDDPILREGAPYPPDPPSRWSAEYKYYSDGARIESAFRKYFHRADVNQSADSYEVVVCHANVIRYFVMRALQLPPEAWLRVSLKNSSITWICIRPNGKVSIWALGEAGHLPPEKLTTS